MGGWQGGAGVQGPEAAGEGLEEAEEADKGIQRLLRAGSPGKGPSKSITPIEAEQGLRAITVLWG